MYILDTQITLEKVRCFAYHGVDPQEKKIGNHFHVTLTVKGDFKAAMDNDDLTLTVSYAELLETIQEQMAIPSELLEHVSGRIHRAIYERFPVIEQIELAITKCNPPMGGDLDGATVTTRSERK